MGLPRNFTLRHAVVGLIAATALGLGIGSCRKTTKDKTKLATVVINELADGTWNKFYFQLVSLNTSNPFKMEKQSFARGVGTVKTTVPAGPYRIVLEYYQDSKMVFSAHGCVAGAPNSDERTFASGVNQVQIDICPDNGAQSAVTGQAAGTFYVSDGRLYDKSGAPFLIRGVSNAHNYYLTEALAALPRIKGFGFNTVRVVWCADTLEREGRCDKKDMHSPGELADIINQMRSLQLVAVLEMQNSTGSDDPAHLSLMADYYTKPEILDILMKNKDMIIINIANEWFGAWQDTSGTYIEAYKSVITRLRQAGLPHLLMIDGGGWGQDFESIKRSYQQLMAADSNVMFSTHMYDVFSSETAVKDAFAFIRANKIPWVVGEFGCSHGDRGAVACDSILTEASSSQGTYGYIAWSYAGNGGGLEDLDITSDWSNLSAWGKRLLNSPGGITATAKVACFFDSQKCK